MVKFNGNAYYLLTKYILNLTLCLVGWYFFIFEFKKDVSIEHFLWFEYLKA